jgi:hypothetical protein
MSLSEIKGSIVQIDILMMFFRALRFILMILAVVYLRSISKSLKNWRKMKDEKNSSISD